MPLGSEGIDLTFKATSAITQYYAVMMDTSNSGQVVVATANAKVIGICQNAPSAGENASVRVFGRSLHVTGEASLTCGDLLTSTSAGTGEQADAAGEYCYGILLRDASGSGTTAEVFVNSVGTAQASDA